MGEGSRLALNRSAGRTSGHYCSKDIRERAILDMSKESVRFVARPVIAPEMKITAVTRTSRSNSLPMIPPEFLPVMNDPKASDAVRNHTRATSTTKDTLQVPPTGRPRGTNGQQASGGQLSSIRDEPYVSIQAADAGLVGGEEQEAQGGSDDTPADTIDANVSANYAAPVAQRGRLFAKCHKSRRLVKKNGHSNVSMTKVEKRNRRYIRDMFTTIMDLKWRYHVLMFIGVFMFSWLFFGVGWLALAYFNGDITRADNDTDICLDNVYDFSTALLYSLETQTTIGYGYRVIGPHCPMGTGLLMTQSCMGIFIQCFITGIVFAKIARPKRRAQTIVFSQHAVVCMRDGFYNLIFRVGDLRKTHIIGTSIRALLVRSRQTNEGELIPLCQYPLELITESSITDSFVFFFWPVTVAHRITPSSPLWDLSAESMLSEHFEVIIILEGTVQSSGSLIQIRTSYVPNEIKWGQRLTPLMTHLRDRDECEIDFSNFHGTTPVSMPDCSAEEYSQRTEANRMDPIETDYPSSFTGPSVRAQEGFYPLRRNPRNNRLQSLFQRNRNIASRMKSNARGKNSAKYDVKKVEDATVSSSFPDDNNNNEIPLVPPPTYASCARSRGEGNPPEGMASLEIPRTTVTVHCDSKDITEADDSPAWSRFGAQVNQAFQTSMA